MSADTSLHNLLKISDMVCSSTTRQLCYIRLTMCLQCTCGHVDTDSGGGANFQNVTKNLQHLLLLNSCWS